jgi:hypothetical protein
MHFIEQLLGLSPDGDSGLTELLIFAVPVTAYFVLSYLRRKRNQAG